MTRVDASQKLTQERYESGSKEQSKLQLELAKNPVQGITKALQQGTSLTAIKFALEGNLALKKSAKNPEIISKIFSSLFQSDKPIIQSLFADLLKDMKKLNKNDGPIGILFSSEAENRAIKPIIASVIKTLSPEKRENLLSFLVAQGVIFEVDKIEFNKNIDQKSEIKKESKDSGNLITNQPKKLEEGKAYHPGFPISYAAAYEIKKTGSKEDASSIQTDAESQFYIKVMETVDNLMKSNLEPKESRVYANKLSNYFSKESVG